MRSAAFIVAFPVATHNFSRSDHVGLSHAMPHGSVRVRSVRVRQRATDQEVQGTAMQQAKIFLVLMSSQMRLRFFGSVRSYASPSKVSQNLTLTPRASTAMPIEPFPQKRSAKKR